MQMQPVNSSNISHIGYDDVTHTLAVTFHSGATYHHTGVSADIYKGLMNAPSKGKYYYTHISSKNKGVRK